MSFDWVFIQTAHSYKPSSEIVPKHPELHFYLVNFQFKKMEQRDFM